MGESQNVAEGRLDDEEQLEEVCLGEWERKIGDTKGEKEVERDRKAVSDGGFEEYGLLVQGEKEGKEVPDIVDERDKDGVPLAELVPVADGVAVLEALDCTITEDILLVCPHSPRVGARAKVRGCR